MLPDSLKIVITGDLCPHNRIEKLVLESDVKSVFNDFIDVFKGSDLNITDLECPLTESVSARPKSGPHQKAHPDCIKILDFANIRLAAKPNNHVMDYDKEGVEHTLRICKDYSIHTV